MMCPNVTQSAMETQKVPDLLQCDASELASYLLKSRFKDDSMATASFLLECTAGLPNAEAISSKLMGGGTEVQVAEPVEEEVTFDFGDAITEPCEVSVTNPRGKFQWTLHEDGIHFKSTKDDVLLVPENAAERIILFPKPEDCRTSKGKVGYMVLLCFKNGEEESVTFKKKTLTQICFQLPTTPPKVPSDGDEEESDWMELLSTSLSLDPQRDIARIYNPTVPEVQRSGYSFQSHKEDSTSTTTGGMPFVKCYKGVQDGVLYPMEEGLLFFKPPFFLPRSEMHSIACGRGSGGSRYVDLVVTLDGGESQKELEFTNIHRDEMSVLNGYIHKVLIPAMTKDANGDKSDQDSKATSNDADVTHTPISATSSEDSPSHRPSKRKASKAAREATRAELSPSQDTDSEEEDEEDEGWNSTEEDDPTSDGDLSLTGVNEVPIDDDSDDDEEDYVEEVEDQEEAEGQDDDETEDEDSATESEDDTEPQTKRARKG